MATADDQPRTRVGRRDALKLLAASTGTVAAGSIIISQPAHADSGSEPCRYDFDGAPNVRVRMINQSGSSPNRPDYLAVSVSGVGGDCPCGNQTEPIQYAFFITIGTLSGGIGWINSSAVSVASPSVLWPNSGGSATIAVGIRAVCPAKGVGTAVRCRWGSSTINIGGPNDSTTANFALSSNNGNSSPPAGIPSCEPSLQRSAPLLRAGSSLGVVAGAPAEPILTDEPDPVTDLGPVEPTGESTTTTTKPGTKPKAPADSTTTTSTTTTTTTPPTTTTTTPPTTTTTTPPADG